LRWPPGATSAFRGRNAVKGTLKLFLDALDKGVIKPGTYLLIESLDRLSRNEVDEAFELFMSIIRRGITIVTLSDEQVPPTCRSSRWCLSWQQCSRNWSATMLGKTRSYSVPLTETWKSKTG
jgi:hypothetical protein